MKRWLPGLVLFGAVVMAAVLWPYTRPQPIRIGVLFSQTGTMAVSEQPLIDAIRLEVEELNAEGGLLGQPVEMVVADGRSDDKVSAQEARRLIEQEQVVALFACWTSSCRRAVKPVVESHNHLMFYPVQYEGLEQSPNILYTGSVPNQQIIPAVRWAMDTFGERLYLVGSDYVFPRAASIFVRDIAHAADAKILGERYLPLGGSDIAAVIADVRRLKPDVIVNTVNGDSNRALFRALHEAGLQDIPVLSFSIAEGELKAMPELAHHPRHYAAWSYFQSQPGEDNRRFVERFRQRFGADAVTSDPVESAYNSVELWAGAVRDAGTAAPAEVNRAIIRQSVAAPSGVLAVDAGTRHVWKALRIGHAKPDGHFEQVFAMEATLRPEPFPAYRSKEEWLGVANKLAGGSP